MRCWKIFKSTACRLSVPSSIFLAKKAFISACSVFLNLVISSNISWRGGDSCSFGISPCKARNSGSIPSRVIFNALVFENRVNLSRPSRTNFSTASPIAFRAPSNRRMMPTWAASWVGNAIASERASSGLRGNGLSTSSPKGLPSRLGRGLTSGVLSNLATISAASKASAAWSTAAAPSGVN